VQVVDIPLMLRRNVIDVWGADGESWLATVPSLVQKLADTWDLQIHGPAGPLSFHYVVEATRKDGSPAVLKIGPTGPGHPSIEAAALDAYAGHGAVRLLAYDPERGALLLEQAAPGTSAAALVPGDDAAATAAIIGVTRQLHHPPASRCLLPDLATQGKAFADHLRAGRGADVLPDRWVQRAARLFGELCASSPGKVVLHGDLHHDNVLQATREPWLAIDPHGVVGDPGYETGALLYNPWPERREAELLALVPARIEQLATGLTMPVERVVAWGFVKAVLSAVWTCQSGTMPGTRALDVAELLLSRLP
jgi:streptomycin 6-kinase